MSRSAPHGIALGALRKSSAMQTLEMLATNDVYWDTIVIYREYRAPASL